MYLKMNISVKSDWLITHPLFTEECVFQARFATWPCTATHRSNKSHIIYIYLYSTINYMIITFYAQSAKFMFES